MGFLSAIFSESSTECYAIHNVSLKSQPRHQVGKKGQSTPAIRIDSMKEEKVALFELLQICATGTYKNPFLTIQCMRLFSNHLKVRERNYIGTKCNVHCSCAISFQYAPVTVWAWRSSNMSGCRPGPGALPFLHLGSQVSPLL